MRVVYRRYTLGGRSPTVFFAYVKLEMKDAPEIYLPNLLLSNVTFPISRKAFFK